jgi:hypothetical protein
MVELTDEQRKVLDSLIEESPLSDEFKAMVAFNGLETFSDLFEIEVGRVPELPRSGYRMYSELLEFLDGHGLLDYADRFVED